MLQLLPSLLMGYKFASFAYFGLLAVSTVYLGAKRQDIPDVSVIQQSGTPSGQFLNSSVLLPPGGAIVWCNCLGDLDAVIFWWIVCDHELCLLCGGNFM